MATDLRLLSAVPIGLVLWLAPSLLPDAGVRATWQSFRYSTAPIANRDWGSLLDIGTVWLFSALFLFFAIRKLINRQHLDYDGNRLTSWSSPFPGGRRTVDGSDVDQLYVSRNRQLRCRTRQDRHVVLGSGQPEALRWMEQQLEQRMKIEDVAVDDEWLPPHQFKVDVRQCPSCGFELPSAEIARQVERIREVGGVSRFEDGDRLVLRYRERGFTFFFLGFWLCIWDPVSLLMFIGGISQVMGGDPKGWKLLMMPHIWVGVAVTYFWATLLMNRVALTAVRGQRLEVTWTPLWWPGYPVVVDLKKLDQLYVVEQSGRQTNYTLEARLAGGGTLTLDTLSDGKRARYLEQELEGFLGIANQDVRGEWKG